MIEITDAITLALQLEEKGHPKQYLSLISSIKTCLTHIENIIENHSPSTYKPVSIQNTGDSKAPPPPVPPKPIRMQKPVVPPKPLKQDELLDNSPDMNNQHDIRIIKPRVSENSSSSNSNSSNSRPMSLPPLQQSHLARVTNRRPYTEFPDSNDNTESTVRIIAEGEVDPDYLVPAQTNAGDSLAPSSSTMNNDHVPLIPAPPLLTTHRLLQAKLDDIEEKLRSCRARKQLIAQGDNSQLETMTVEELDQTIAQYLRVMSDLKVDLNTVRTIYMNAATIPTVLQFGAHVIAYQITLIEAAIFDAIPPLALLEHSSKRPHPRIVASTDFFNYITRCIEHAVLLPQEASSRAQLIHYWIKVASRCFDVNNYQTLKAIISALNTPPVQRLKRTWAYVPKKSSTKLDSLNELMSEANNYGLYREHMGMVSTTVVNGKSVQLIRDEHYSRPTVPFLGTFILDITYLLAAFKSSPNASKMQPQNEPRIHEVITTLRRFQTGPRYTSSLPTSFLKSSQKHHFRPAISNALHRGASRIQRISGGNIFSFDSGSNNSINGNTSSSNLSSVGEKGPDDDDDGTLEEQQKMATQYILMRSWVSQNTVDELSHLREPPQIKSNSLYGPRSSSSGPTATSMNRTSSVFSNASSNVRFSTGSVSLNTLSTAGGSGGDSRPASMDDFDEEEKKRNGSQPNSFFSSFRRSDSGSIAQRPNTIHEGLERSDTNDSGLSREEQENFHVAENKRTTWNGHPATTTTNAPSTQAPVVPPRPVPRAPPPPPPPHPVQNDEFKAALAQRLAKKAS
ncbi:hypothetical protein HPULCUR_009464 [Helicostylum pulchrum]|uniref:Ras-GEF domain-containing protein n=1 Tax=Helicostylum pulchrum TaxID=562976 RepID=A0ABP9YAH6_9FUNG